MAFYVGIRKVAESSVSVKYKFGVSDDLDGLLEIDKATGKVLVVSAPAGDEGGRISQRASVKVMKHWMAGEFPEETCWAS